MTVPCVQQLARSLLILSPKDTGCGGHPAVGARAPNLRTTEPRSVPPGAEDAAKRTRDKQEAKRVCPAQRPWVPMASTTRGESAERGCADGPCLGVLRPLAPGVLGPRKSPTPPSVLLSVPVGPRHQAPWHASAGSSAAALTASTSIKRAQGQEPEVSPGASEGRLLSSGSPDVEGERFKRRGSVCMRDSASRVLFSS